jgi:uncharacterized membrane protein
MESDRLILQTLLFFILTFIPGILLLRLFRAEKCHIVNKILYAFGLGLIFVVATGLIANYMAGFNSVCVWGVYTALLIGLIGMTISSGHKTFHKEELKYLIIPAIIYIASFAMQAQTTMISNNLIGSDIHLEYFLANRVLENGFWEANYAGTTVNPALGVTILMPAYKILTGMPLVWCFKIIAPLIFAFLPVAMYRIFKQNFGRVIAVLSVIFFITMPMFTMDMVQLLRQQHSELFFVFVVLLLFDRDISLLKRSILGALFSAGVITTHYGFAIGYIGYLLIGIIVIMVLSKVFKHFTMRKLAFNGLMAILLLCSIGIYAGYYNIVGQGEVIAMSSVPTDILTNTVNGAGNPIDKNSKSGDAVSYTDELEIPEFIENHAFLNPFWREPLLKTAIGLDYTRASALGKVWRILQYIIELCLVVGAFVFVFKYRKKVKIEYVAFVITSICIILGMYVLHTYSYGMGATRVFQVALIFISPLIVIGLAHIFKFIFFRKTMTDVLLVASFLAVVTPYYIFNSGMVYEMAKLEQVGFVDVPYSIALSGERSDIATVFDDEDIEAADWLKTNITGDDVLYGDTHGARLLIQKFGVFMSPHLMIGGCMQTGKVQSLEGMTDDAKGYMLLRKLNVDNDIITAQGEYGCRMTYDLSDYGIVSQKIDDGEIVFDNGARIIKIK